MAALPKPASDGVSHLSLLVEGDSVWTPTGRQADVVYVNRELGEATVQWEDGERGHFRIIQLRRMPPSRRT